MIDSLLPDRYEATGKKFSGGQGDVYICLDKYLEREVAIKIAEKTKLKYGLTDEISALNAVSSKHVIEIYDTLADGDRIVGLIEEYVPGEDLSNYHITLNTHEEYLNTIYQVACGIRDIHNSGHIHRDIKPDNIKFDAEGIIKILDFGLANPEAGATTTKAHGTFGFRAPEMYQGGSMPINCSIDTYAFGATAWALAGGLPAELLELPPQASSKVRTFAGIIPELDQRVTQAIDACLDTDPNRRPDMNDVTKTLSQSILKDKHRGVLIGSKRFEIHRSQPRVKIGVTNYLIVEYTGYDFKIVTVQGDVFVNNIVAMPGSVLPGSSVITLGDQSLGAKRAFISFDISHPEVVL